MSDPPRSVTFFWWLLCPYGDSLQVNSPTDTPLVPLDTIRCPYHDVPTTGLVVPPVMR